jgi:RimJ/RimL family protein N-acetyltransferase
MRRIVATESDRVGTWVMAQNDAIWLPGQGQCYGVEDSEGRLLAGIAFDNYNGASVQIHVAALPGKNWITKSLLHRVFSYPFHQLGVKKLIGLVGSTNADALRFDLALGFCIEATLKDAYPDGDLHILSMTQDQCRWLDIIEKDRSHGQEIVSPGT